jgi:hypothetical protein
MLSSEDERLVWGDTLENNVSRRREEGGRREGRREEEKDERLV